jgi:peroxiredoxin
MRPAPSPRAQRLRGLARDLVIAVLLVLAVRAFHLRDAASGHAPSFAVAAVTGAPVQVPAPDGQPTLLYFWATWCGTCSAMRGNVTALSDGQRVVSVASRSGGQAEVAAFARAHGIAYPVVADEGDRLMRAYGVRAFPTSFVVDGDGEISHVEVGYTTELGLRARLWLARFL